MTSVRVGGNQTVRVGGNSTVNQRGTIRAIGTYVSTFSPSSGLPTTGSGPSGSILKGDYWKASGSGTLSGVSPFTDFSTGDLLYASINGATVAADFFGNKSTGGGGGGTDEFQYKDITEDYTLVLDDANDYILRCDSATDIAITVPDFDTVAFTEGMCIQIQNVGSGSVTLVEDGVTIDSTSGDLVVPANGSITSLLHLSAENEWDFQNGVSLTKSDVGLSNVDNTSDVNKPVSTAQATADAAVLTSAQSYADSAAGSVQTNLTNYQSTNDTAVGLRMTFGQSYKISTLRL